MTDIRGSILLVDDEEKILKALGRALREAGHRVADTTSAREAQRLLAERSFDLLIVDNVMPELTGLELIREYVHSTPEGERPQVLMMTAHATVESAIEAMKLGALDYLQKPFEIDELLVVVRRALDHQRLRTEHRYLLSERDEQFDHYGIIGRSKSMVEVIHRAELVAATKSTVLITGETGTGKELIAREIHRRGPRKSGPFVAINCGAIPENLLESELFGHAKGAFTGAVAARPGRFQAASGGTLFLDEIGEMPSALQVKLLRALQDRAVTRVGENKPEAVDIRVVAATNKDLDEEMKAGRFREDLYYRINVVHLHLPALRDRGEDAAMLAKWFLGRAVRELGSKVKGFSPQALVAVKRYRWPGNIRQLENRIKKAVVLADRPLISPDDLELRPEQLEPILPLAEARDEWQKRYINEVLERNAGNRTKTAKDLGVDPRTIFRHLERMEAEKRGETLPPDEALDEQ